MIQLHHDWPLALLDRFRLLARRPVLYRLRNGVQFLVDARTLDVRVINEIWIDQVYTSLPGFLIRDGWTIADVGGHKGIFSVLAATAAAGTNVYTFEPSPQSFAILSQNIVLNRLSNVRIFNVAVSSKEGRAVLHLAAEPGCNSLIERSDVQTSADVDVETWSMRRLLKTIPSAVNLLKIDIEGMEYEALLSCPATDLERVERIVLEYHDDHIPGAHNTPELVQFLNSLGFVTHLRPERRLLFAERTQSLPPGHPGHEPR